MRLRGQHGYAMVVLLVSLSIMAIMMTVAMPVYKQIAQREKEAELSFAGSSTFTRLASFSEKWAPGVSAEHRRPLGTALPPQEIQRSDHRRRLRAASGGSGFSDAWTAHRYRPTPWRWNAGTTNPRCARPTFRRDRPNRRRSRRRGEQEHRRLDSYLQRPHPLQRVGIPFPRPNAGAGCRRRACGRTPRRTRRLPAARWSTESAARARASARRPAAARRRFSRRASAKPVRATGPRPLSS